ncbi:M20/M25/M40 family metallo-hydrolase [candidate division KSB1 bacterium]|nr:M20/M25/M40 family metallo-hydrolase [candidate division KSB1 bacterium]
MPKRNGVTTLVLSAFIFLSMDSANGQRIDHTRLEWLANQYGKASFTELRESLSIPNDAHFPEHVEKNLQWMEAALKKRNFRTTVLTTPGTPLLLAEYPVKNAAKAVLVYLQVDGQPVDPSQWHQKSPYIPVLKKFDGTQWQEIAWENLGKEIDPEWRIFARSASDAKGPILMFLTALDAIHAERIAPTFNLKVILDFEEERGSPNLPFAVEKYKDRLKADMLIIFDGPRHISNRPTLTFGARGIATIELKVFGPKVPQHSGHYGNYVPNPAQRLARLLASMEDEDGKVNIAGFYDGVQIDQKTLNVMAQVPDDENDLKRKLGIAQSDKVGRTYQESLQYPSLNIRGMASGWVGDEVRTIIPSTALAELDVRLVPETDAERLIGLIKQHVENQGYYLVASPPTDEERAKHPKIASFNYNISYAAFRTPIDSEAGGWLSKAMIRAFNEEPIKIRMSGGSIPISPFINTLGIPAVTVPTVNRDNNQHSPNENLRVGNYIEGVKTFLAILTQKFD